jgi:hypothetical protein
MLEELVMISAYSFQLLSKDFDEKLLGFSAGCKGHVARISASDKHPVAASPPRSKTCKDCASEGETRALTKHVLLKLL